jgi:hypothetical protein
MVYPLFLAERFLFIFIAFTLRNKFFLLQMSFLIYLKLAILCFYLHEKPFDISRGVTRMKFFAEYLHLVIYTLALCFSFMVLDPETRFKMGWVVIFLVGANVFINFAIIIYDVLRSSKFIQEKYEAFKEKFTKK